MQTKLEENDSQVSFEFFSLNVLLESHDSRGSFFGKIPLNSNQIEV